MCRQSIIALKYVITNIESKNESNLLPKVFKKMRQNCQCLEEIEKTLLEEENVNRKYATFFIFNLLILKAIRVRTSFG